MITLPAMILPPRRLLPLLPALFLALAAAAALPAAPEPRGGRVGWARMIIPGLAWDLHSNNDPAFAEFIREPRFALAMGRLECHYFVNRGFLKPQTQLLDRAARIAGIPAKIVHGRYDVICPPASAWRLHALLPRSELAFVEGAGHSGSDPLIAQALVAATNAFAGS